VCRARDAFAAIAGFVAYGLLLSLVWVRLYGIDVALTEAAIGGGLTGALLIGAASRLRGTEAAAVAERRGAGTRLVAALLSLAVAPCWPLCVLALPEPAPTLAPAVVAQHGASPASATRSPRAAGLPRARHAARGDRAAVRADRRLVARARPRWGGRPGLRSVPTRTASSPTPRGCCRRSASSSACTSSGPAPTIPAASSRAPPSWRRCGCWCMMAGLADAPPIGGAGCAWPAGRRAAGVHRGRLRRRLATAGAFLAYPPAGPSR
jgi:uncharacterized MnhB-related membrane protein